MLLFPKNGFLSFLFGLNELTPLIQSGRIKPERYISHTLPLSDGAHAYDIFDRRVDGAMKMVFEI